MKTIIVDNKDKFYSKLFLYKLILYRSAEFKTEIEDEELKKIVEALNIKNRNKKIEFIYDYCCSKIDKFYEGKNLCSFKDNKCIMHQKPNCNHFNGCCSLCFYQSNKGCKTSNLSCKLFFCDKIKNDNEILKFKDLKILKLFGLRQRLICRYNYFASREEFLIDLKIGLLFFYSCGVLKRTIRNSLFIRKMLKNEEK